MIARGTVVLALLAALAAGSACAIRGSFAAGKPAKVSAELLALHESYGNAQRSGAEFRPTNPLLRVVEDRVLIEAVASGDASVLETDLVALGMRHAAAFGAVVSGELPIVSIPALESLGSLAVVRPSTPRRSPALRTTPGRP